MKALHMNEIAKAVHAIDYDSTKAHESVTGVAFDSRKVVPGDLFVPLVAARDGHDFIEDAIANGAVATLWSAAPRRFSRDIECILVDDTLQALQDLSRYYLSVIQPKVVAITGSAGKTTTKDMTAAVLSAVFAVHKTAENENNEIGVPMTILAMPEDTDVLVLEMGMSGPGEIHTLSTIATPDIAVVTMIGESHLEAFGSRAGIADAKLEILDGLKAGGAFIYPGDEPLIRERLDAEPPFQTITVGLDENEDVYAMQLQVAQKETTFHINISPEMELSIPVAGAYNVKNALMACAVAYSLGVSIESLADKLAHFTMTANRMQWIDGNEHVQILNDSYNANPSAMQETIDTFKQMPEPALDGRRLLCLGDMLELGDAGAELHAGVAAHIDPNAFAHVFLYGPLMQHLNDALIAQGFPPTRIHYVPDDKDALIAAIKQEIRPDDQILVKGSHGMGLIDVVDALRKDNA